jgi:hypothetical protein
VYIFQTHQRFKFNNYPALHDKIGSPASFTYALIENRLFNFPIEIQSGILKLNSQSPLVNNLLKAITERTMHLHGTTVYPVCNFICIHN